MFIVKREDMNEKIPFADLKPKKVSDILWCAVVKAWENGLSDREAAFRASKESGTIVRADEIKKWKKDDPRVAELCEMLKDDIKALAKCNAKKLLEAGDDKTTRWYLEHKCPEEFSTKSAVAFEGAVVELSLDEKQKALEQLLETFENGK